MPRILGVDIPKEKPIEVSLMSLYGVGRPLARKVVAITGIDPTKRAKDLTDEEISKLAQAVSAQGKMEGDLRREVAAHIKRLIDIGSYRGTRHKKGLPVRGQRTRTNARSRKGPRPRVGVRKKARVTAPSTARAAT
ncbi:MAG: 30S ribosomal protein S13 [Candidatus Omnitrophica bacterium]|nr:30S ribosomal protein S13 [Candidatus Omnitrophota bacterium]